MGKVPTRLTSESEAVAALTVQGGLVRNKMKVGVYNKPRVFFFYWNTKYTGPTNMWEFVGTAVPTNLSEQYTF